MSHYKIIFPPESVVVVSYFKMKMNSYLKYSKFSFKLFKI